MDMDQQGPVGLIYHPECPIMSRQGWNQVRLFPRREGVARMGDGEISVHMVLNPQLEISGYQGSNGPTLFRTRAPDTLRLAPERFRVLITAASEAADQERIGRICLKFDTVISYQDVCRFNVPPASALIQGERQERDSGDRDRSPQLGFLGLLSSSYSGAYPQNGQRSCSPNAYREGLPERFKSYRGKGAPSNHLGDLLDPPTNLVPIRSERKENMKLHSCFRPENLHRSLEVMMDVKRSSGRSAMPQLLVKIVGGRQIKRLVDPNRHVVHCAKQTVLRGTQRDGSGVPILISTEAAGNHGPSDAPKASEEAARKTSARKLELPSPAQHTESAVIYAALTQVPDRACVTAPGGDRSRSYVHPRRPAANNTNQTLTQPFTEQEVRHALPGDRLLLVVSRELEGWEFQTLERMEEDIAALDPSHTGAVHQSELTYLFLRWKVPLRLPTLASLLNLFCVSAHPEQVMYQELLHFIQNLTLDQELQNTEVDIWKASPEPENPSDAGSVWSDGVLMSVDPGETETWVQRFQKMESALRLCDSQNTGFLEKEQARRLIQNYSQIFDLNLSPLKINQAMRNAQVHGRVHVGTALQLLKGR
ncbi:hypothetical protein NFI96_013988 [Prochilodus magdalenae]|nr:hypothetical protein NFI96_013988 [Prochilodus magdalenae]